MSKITDGQRDTLRLIARSPDIGEGWRKVSEMCCQLLADSAPHKPPPELYEFEKYETGGRVRLTDKGEVVVFYT